MYFNPENDIAGFQDNRKMVMSTSEKINTFPIWYKERK